MPGKVYRFEVTQKDFGKRLDKFLVESLPKDFSRSFIQKLISEQNVLLNNVQVKSHRSIKRGDVVEITIPEARPSSITAEKIPLDIVYEDDHLLVVNKPASMVVHPAPGNYTGTLVNALLRHCKNLSGIGGIMKPGIVHRIDKGTSGLLVVAKTDESHKALAKQFKAKTTTRKYIAIVKGMVQLDNGIIELPIGRSVRDRKRMAVNFVNSKTAITTYKVLERFRNATMLELTLATGRTHQIRVHMSYLGHPILGDETYGQRGGLARPMLHASKIGFIHPVMKKYMEFERDLPADMKELISRLRL